MRLAILHHKLSLFGLCLFIAGCSVQGTDKEVTVVYPADKIAIAEQAAESHCAKFDRTARHVQSRPVKSNSTTLFLRTRTSIFECVER